MPTTSNKHLTYRERRYGDAEIVAKWKQCFDYAKQKLSSINAYLCIGADSIAIQNTNTIFDDYYIISSVRLLDYNNTFDYIDNVFKQYGVRTHKIVELLRNYDDDNNVEQKFADSIKIINADSSDENELVFDISDKEIEYFKQSVDKFCEKFVAFLQKFDEIKLLEEVKKI